MSKKKKTIKIRTKKGWIAYPGSTVQQNYAEELTHGYLLWEIQDRNNFDVKFCELPNPKPFVTIDWRGNVEKTLEVARTQPQCARFRIRSNDVLPQKEATELMSVLQTEMKATEVTFKNNQLVNHDMINTGVATMAKADLRNPDILIKLLRDYHKEANITDAEWDAVRDQVVGYLSHALENDDLVRNTKWTFKHLAFDNMFAYGEGNVINFDNLPGIVGIFGPNRAGKSSIVGSIMYSLFNMSDRGNVKNLHIVNVRKPYCYTKAIIGVNGTNYVIERQTVKHETKRGQVHAGTALNIFRIDENGEAIDLAGEQRNDTEKVLRKLIGSGEDCMLTSVAAQDDVKQFINQGSSKRRKDLSRFLDLDIFDRMYELAKNDVNINKGTLRNLPDRDWSELERSYIKKLQVCADLITEKGHELHVADQRLHDVRTQLSSFKDFTLVTKSQVESQQALVTALGDRLINARGRMISAQEESSRLGKKVLTIESLQLEHDLSALKSRLEAYRTLESSFDSLKHVHEKDAAQLKIQERSLKILDEVPCGDEFPGCKFIKDAHKNKDKVEPQREKVNRALEKLEKAELALIELKKEGLVDKVAKIEQLSELRSKLKVTVSDRNVEIVKLETTINDLNVQLSAARQRLVELEEALKNEENLEVVTLRHTLDELQRTVKHLDSEKMSAASEAGRVQSDYDKIATDRAQRQEMLQLMKVHELIAQAFSRKGIPSLIVTSQLPVINAEVAKILSGIVDFSVELEVDDDSDSMEVYINYGDSRRPIELGSGMEKTLASIAIRVALINVSSLPKTDMFIIDESFGPLDPSSVEACNRLLLSLKNYFKTIIVITHVDGVKDVADHVIEITKAEKDAKVVYS